MLSPVPTVLLVTWTPPGDRNVGEVILRDLCSFLPDACLRICEVSRFEGAGSRYERIRLEAPDEKPWRPLPGRAGGLLNHIRIRTRFRRAADRLVSTIADYAHANQVDKIWLTLSSQTLIRVGSQLSKATHLPIFSLVWDPPDFLARHQSWDSASVGWTKRNFHRAMRASSAAMVVSDSMVKRYVADYGIPCTIVRHAFAAESSARSLSISEERGIRIGFAGTLYDQSQLDCLISALNPMEWCIGGRKVTLRMIGNYYRFTKLNRPSNIELLGWRSTTETRQLLSECDFTYLPVSFQPGSAEFARLAFPTKLSTFLAAGRPVLVHAPDYAAPASFCREHGFGVVCSSMSTADLQRSMVEIVSPTDQAALVEKVRKTCSDYFSRSVMRRQFASFLGVSEELLNE